MSVGCANGPKMTYQDTERIRKDSTTKKIDTCFSSVQ